MDYTISLNASGNEVTEWHAPVSSCGDFPECHAEPPTCGCPPEGTCEAVDTVSDDAFGFWDDVWGPPDVHEFPCEDPATETVRDDYDGSPVRVCARHAR
jgi:hypothetical protein